MKNFISDDEMDALVGGKATPGFISDEEMDALSAPKKQGVSMGESALAGGAQGIAMGFGDELSGGAGYLAGKLGWVPDKGYEYYRDYARQQDKLAQEANPNTYGASALGGGLATAALMPSAGATLGKTVASGAAQGGLAGLGSSDADLLSKEAAMDTAAGIGLGSIAGGLGYGAGKALEKGANALPKLGDKASELAELASARGLGAERGTIKSLGRDKVREAGRYALDNDVLAGSTEKMIARNNALGREGGEMMGDVYRQIDEGLPLTERQKIGLAVKKFEENPDKFERIGFGQYFDVYDVDGFAIKKPNTIWTKQDNILDHALNIEEMAPSEILQSHKVKGLKDDYLVQPKLEKSASRKQAKEIHDRLVGQGFDVDDIYPRSGTGSPNNVFVDKTGRPFAIDVDRVNHPFLGDYSEAAKKRFIDLNTENLNKKSASTFNPRDVASKFESEVGERWRSPLNKGATNQYDNTLEAITMRGDEPISMRQAQILKEELGQAANWKKPLPDLSEKELIARQAYSVVNKAIDEAAEQGSEAIGVAGLKDLLQKGKKQFGDSETARKLLDNKFAREEGNKFIGLTDAVVGAGGLGYGYGTGDWKTAGAIVAGKKGLEKFGPKLAAQGLDKIGDILKSSPQVFGKFAKVLQNAAARGPQGIAATHFILQQQDPEYQELMKNLQSENDGGQEGFPGAFDPAMIGGTN